MAQSKTEARNSFWETLQQCRDMELSIMSCGRKGSEFYIKFDVGQRASFPFVDKPRYRSEADEQEYGDWT